MISVIDVVNFLRAEFPDLSIYPIEYPLKATEGASVVTLHGNTEATAGLFPAIVQIKVRDVHPSLSEATCFKYKKLLENKTNFYINDVQVVMVKSQNPLPLYMGKDEKNRYLYSNNFRFVFNEGGNN
jgi:hypothetical protein